MIAPGERDQRRDAIVHGRLPACCQPGVQRGVVVHSRMPLAVLKQQHARNRELLVALSQKSVTAGVRVLAEIRDVVLVHRRDGDPCGWWPEGCRGRRGRGCCRKPCRKQQYHHEPAVASAVAGNRSPTLLCMGKAMGKVF